jgi:hypothetical protein
MESMSKATESIYDGVHCVVPLAEVQHIEKVKRGPYRGEEGLQPNGLRVITSMTKLSLEAGDWANPVFVPQDESAAFMAAWCRYRSEIESETLLNLEHGINE